MKKLRKRKLEAEIIKLPSGAAEKIETSTQIFTRFPRFYILFFNIIVR